MLSNLVVNAIKYGAADAPIRVCVIGETADVRIEVRNSGSVMEESALAGMFEPLTRGAEAHSRDSAGGSVGLGLFIALEIAKAHRGEINARSDEKETLSAVRVPRRQ